MVNVNYYYYCFQKFSGVMQLYMSKKARANNIRMEFFIYEEVQLEKEKPKKLFTPAKKILPMKT